MKRRKKLQCNPSASVAMEARSTFLCAWLCCPWEGNFEDCCCSWTQCRVTATFWGVGGDESEGGIWS